MGLILSDTLYLGTAIPGGGGSSLPDQTGHSGEFLTTDGTDASWAAVDALPSQTGNSGKFLTTDGTNASWSDKPLVNNATGTAAIAINKAIASGESAIAIGNTSGGAGFYPAQATGTNSIAIGGGTSQGTYSARSTGYYTIAMGYSAYARGTDSVAIGSSPEATDWSVAIGMYARVSGKRTVLIGSYNQGYNHYISENDVMYFQNGNGQFKLLASDGTIPTDRYTTTPSADGTYVPTLTISSGTPTRSWAAPSGGLPSQTGNSGKFLTTDGTDASWATISALQNTATGNQALTINGTACPYEASVNIGSSSQADEKYSVAIGYNAKAWWQHGTAVGYGAVSNKANATAIGDSANANGQYAIQLGVGTNSNANTFSVGLAFGSNYQLLSSDGTIPTARLTKANTTVTLAVADWSSSTQTVSVTGVTATSVVLVAPDSTSQSDYTSAGILCTAQGAGTLTFTCSTTPTNAITVNVVAL